MYLTRYPVLSCEQNKAIWLATVSAVWYDVWYFMAQHGIVVWTGMDMQVWYGMVWYGMVWYGMVWYGMVWYGMVWYMV
jgi:chloride channel 2